MIPERSPTPSAAASLARLRRYRRCWELVIERGLSRERFRRIDAELLALQRHMDSWPLLAADFAELMMRHAQLLRSLAKPGDEGRRRAEVQALGRQHRRSIEALRERLTECAAPA